MFTSFIPHEKLELLVCWDKDARSEQNRESSNEKMSPKYIKAHKSRQRRAQDSKCPTVQN